MRFFVLLVVVGLCAGPVWAQEGTKPEPAPDINSAAPRNTLDTLFDRLAKARDEEEAKGIAGLIERRWARSGSDTADLLLSRAQEAAEAKDYPLAVELLDRTIALQPRWAEAWNQRATMFYLLDDPVAAMVDLHQALLLEPRQFNAWAGLGQIYMASDDKAHALQAYRQALKIDPYLPSLRKVVDKLAIQVDGTDL